MTKKEFFKEILIVWDVLLKNNYKETNYDYYLFYAQFGCIQMRKIFNFSDEKIFFSGYPIVLKKLELLNLKTSKVDYGRRKIIFIHQPFIMDKESNANYEVERKYLCDINMICQGKGFKLVVYIHPRENKNDYEKRFANSKICFEQETKFLESIRESELVFGFYSTALFYAVCFKKPIFILPYPGLKSLSSLDYFAQVGIKISSISDLQSFLGSEEIYCKKLSNYEGFRRMYIGENNSYEHQATIIDKIYDIA